MKQLLKEHKGKAIASSLLILVPMALGLILWKTLPQALVTHWGADGVADGTGSKVFAVFGLPLILLGLHWLCLWFTARDPRQKGQNRKALGLIFWIMPMVSLVASSVVYSAALGQQISVQWIVPALLGVLFTVMGNYLPKIKRNSTLGIKTAWTVGNEENWSKTHRFGGKVWFIGGLAILISLLLPGDAVTFSVMIGAILVLAIAPAVYSWALYRKQIKAGTYEDQRETSRFQKIFGIVGAVVGLGILILAGVLMTTGDIDFRLEQEELVMEASWYEDLAVAYDEIDSLEYRDTDDFGTRAFGFGSARLMMGTFENDEFGSYTRYSYVAGGPCIVLTMDQKTLVLSCRTGEETRALYEQLLEVWEP